MTASTPTYEDMQVITGTISIPANCPSMTVHVNPCDNGWIVLLACALGLVFGYLLGRKR